MMTIDLHTDVPWQFYKQGVADLNTKQPSRAVDFPRMKQGKLDAIFCALYLSDEVQDSIHNGMASDLIDTQIDTLLQQPRSCKVVDNMTGASKAKEDGLTPIFLGLEGGRLIHDSLIRLETLRGYGLRYLTVVHNRNTAWADSATDKYYHKGITPFGIKVIKKAEELGVYMDVSHASDDTAKAVLEHSTKPVLATHSGCRSITNHSRNLTDDLIKAIAASSGVIGVPFVKKFIGDSSLDIWSHIDHIAQLVGDVNNIGIGSDLDGATMVDDVPDVSKWDDVLSWGSSLGYKEDEVAQIAGGNIAHLLE